MVEIKALYDNADVITTRFNGTPDEAVRYYLGNKHVFDYGEREETAICDYVDIISAEGDEIYQVSAYRKNGEAWLAINGDTHYPLSRWTVDRAMKDYVSEEHKAWSDAAFRKAWGFYS